MFFLLLQIQKIYLLKYQFKITKVDIKMSKIKSPRECSILYVAAKLLVNFIRFFCDVSKKK